MPLIKISLSSGASPWRPIGSTSPGLSSKYGGLLIYFNNMKLDPWCVAWQCSQFLYISFFCQCRWSLCWKMFQRSNRDRKWGRNLSRSLQQLEIMWLRLWCIRITFQTGLTVMVQDCIRLINNIKLQESYSSPYFVWFCFPGGLPYKSDGDARSLA